MEEVLLSILSKKLASDLNATWIQYLKMFCLILFYSKGISASALPYKRTPPSWLKISAQDVSHWILLDLFFIRI